ncbi:MAG: hypothetical protein WC011_02335 [Candidatus Paceibacterota bacterium]
MKKSFLLLLGIILFSITAGTQDLEIKPEKPNSVPDCNLKGIPFRTYKDGIWIYHHKAGYGYALILNSIGETLNLSPEGGIDYFDKALSNPVVKNMSGYIGALSTRKDGTYCVSFSEKLSTFDGRFVCRINSDWALYRREGCANPALVYDPQVQGDRDIKLLDTIYMVSNKVCCCDTTIVIVNCPAVVTDTNRCCDVPRLSWPLVYPMVGYRSTYDSPLMEESMFIGLGYRKHWRDSMQMNSNYAGTELTAFRSTRTDVSCDSCLTFVEGRPENLALRWEVFVGREFGIMEKSDLRGFVEGRYALLQPKVGTIVDQRFLPKKSGVTLRGGARYDLFQKFQLQGSYEYDPIANLSGGELRLIFKLI